MTNGIMSLTGELVLQDPALRKPAGAHVVCVWLDVDILEASLVTGATTLQKYVVSGLLPHSRIEHVTFNSTTRRIILWLSHPDYPEVKWGDVAPLIYITRQTEGHQEVDIGPQNDPASPPK